MRGDAGNIYYGLSHVTGSLDDSKRAKKQWPCVDCGALISTTNAKRCGPCTGDHIVKLARESDARRRARRKAEARA